MPLARTHTSLDYDDYGMLSSSLWLPDLNRSVYTTPSGCSMSYRMNMTVHDPAEFDQMGQSYYSERKKSRSRLSRALKELWNRGSRKDLSKSMYEPNREHSPKKRRGTSVAPTSRTYQPNYVYVPAFSTPQTRSFRAYNRAPSADAAILFEDCNRRPVRIQSFAVPEPRVVQFRQPRLKKNPKCKGYCRLESRSWIARSPAPVTSRQEDHLYSKLLHNCVAFTSLSCREFTGAGNGLPSQVRDQKSRAKERDST